MLLLTKACTILKNNSLYSQRSAAQRTHPHSLSLSFLTLSLFSHMIRVLLVLLKNYWTRSLDFPTIPPEKKGGCSQDHYLFKSTGGKNAGLTEGTRARCLVTPPQTQPTTIYLSLYIYRIKHMDRERANAKRTHSHKGPPAPSTTYTHRAYILKHKTTVK